MKFPSTKASSLILLIVILSTGIIVYSNYKEQAVEPVGKVTTNPISIESKIRNTNIDSDNDGLLDWEESLWGTDPNNPDTDGDGTNDGDEVNQNRNPLVAGPNDEMISPEDKIISQIQQRNLDESGLTNQVATNFADIYFNSRAGGELTNEQKEQLVNNISSQALEQINLNPIYNINSVTTFNPQETPEELINYTDLYLANQVEVLNSIVKNYENLDYKNLGNQIIQKSNELLSIKTPQQIANLHLDLANSYYQLGLIFKNFDREEEDPLYTMLSLRFYEDFQIQIEDINTQIGDFLAESGIILRDSGIEIKND